MFQADSYRDGFLRRNCSEKDTCSLRDRLSFINGYVDLNTTFESSGLAAAWQEDKLDMDTVRKFLLRVENPVEERIFLMSKKLKRIAEQFSPSDEFAHKLGFPDAGSLSNSTKITMTEDIVSRLSKEFFSRKQQNYTHVPEMFHEVWLPPNEKGEHYGILIPYRDNHVTSSIFTAFVIYTTYAVVNRIGLKTNVTLYGVMLRSQRLAYELFASSREWDGNTAAKSLLSPEVLESAVLTLYNGDDGKIHAHVRRNNPDRVATVLYWKKKARETLIILNLGLPQLSISTNTSSGISPFYIVTDGEHAKESNPVSSAAGVMILHRRGSSVSEPIMAASASGSLRTVDGVASAILRMLLLNEDPGSAVCASPSIYYDYRDGQYHCDGSIEFLDGLHREFGIECLDVPRGDQEANDWIVIAARHRVDDGDIVAAMHDADLNFNYAVGY
ncbi:hypothetical protein Y032_0073g773 [Ancylostoma ceylanicum]|uniref:Uncharacterized protein n=1 Tax=Ancylostoma ceylanicum TaxID=53326 RepID=A0A016TVT7_9BILA|nr:hypothetical protein Y032_0073g773 [Ancylostoma ceylanicum]